MSDRLLDVHVQVGLPAAARAESEALLKVQTRTAKQLVPLWRRVSPNAISETWTQQLPLVEAVVTAGQVEAASVAANHQAAMLGQSGFWTAPKGFVDVDALGGFAADGRGLEGLLYSPATHTKKLIGGGRGVTESLQAGGERLLLITKTLLSDAARQASSIMVTARPGVGYVRMTSPPSCPDCMILAGRFYRWNSGFLRHPGCDCVHVPAHSKSTAGARAEGLVDDPYEIFKSLSTEQQNEMFGKANAAAIRDGADIFQVVNSKRGLSKTGLFTTAGTTKSGYAHGLLQPGQRRATPELIYQWAGGSRDKATELLKQHGYILPGGQNPLGVLRGQREGFGALGAGGARKAASQAVMEARLTGVRDPNVRYTMTAAERRLYDAERAWNMVLEGRNPYASPGFGNIPDPHGLRVNTIGGGGMKLTPQIAAQVEAHYMKMLTKKGEYFTH